MPRGANSANEALAPRVLAIDPGRDKCGLALLDARGRVLRRAVVRRGQLVAAVVQWLGEGVEVVIGAGTTSASAIRELAAAGVHPRRVNEAGSTLEARRLYWEANPPRGWRRLVPRGLLVPPEPVDDWAAVLVGRRYLASAAGDGEDGP